MMSSRVSRPLVRYLLSNGRSTSTTALRAGDINLRRQLLPIVSIRSSAMSTSSEKTTPSPSNTNTLPDPELPRFLPPFLLRMLGYYSTETTLVRRAENLFRSAECQVSERSE